MTAQDSSLDAIRGRATLPLYPDTARLLGLGKNGIYRAAAEGELPFVRKIGGRYIVVVPELLRWLGAENGDDPAGTGPSESSISGRAEGGSDAE